LGKTVAADLAPVAVLGKKRLYLPLPYYIIVEYLVGNAGNIVEYISVFYKALVYGGGVCNVEIISAGAVVFGVYSV